MQVIVDFLAVFRRFYCLSKHGTVELEYSVKIVYLHKNEYLFNKSSKILHVFYLALS